MDSTHFVTGAEGVRVAYDAAGSGDVGLIFVHGWSCDRSYWRKQAPFCSEYLVVTVDLGGHGDSAGLRDDWSVQSFGFDVTAVADKIDAKQIILIGHSMGGPVVLEAAQQLGDRVIAVIGVDTFRDVSIEPLSQEDAQRAYDVAPGEFPARTETQVRNAFFIANSPLQLVDEISSDMSRGNPQVAAKSGASLLVYDVRQAMSLLQDKPIALINAKYKTTNVEAFESAHPSSSVSIIENSGHFVMLEQPSEFNLVLARELDRLVASR